MLTKKDIQNLIEALKEIFVTKEEFSEYIVEFRQMATSVDNIAQSVGRHDDEIKVLNSRVSKLENN